MTPSADALATNNLASRLDEALDAVRSIDRYRNRRPLRVVDATNVELDGRRLINFAGNDYLALSRHADLQSARFSSIAAGSTASALVTGYTTEHADAEACIARWKGTDRAVLLPSGYQANHAAIQTFAAMGRNRPESMRFLVDKLAHASLIDAIRATGCPFRVFPHNGMDKLRRLLETSDREQLQVIVTESIFSMDGDACLLPEIAKLREQFGCAILLDEAHGSGVYGPGGSGFAAELKLRDAIDVSVCTFSKAAGLVGGAVCASTPFCEALVNFGRAYIYSTAVPPTLAKQIEKSIELMASEPWRQRIVRRSTIYLRAKLAEAGWIFPAGDSPIVPLVVGDESAALAAARKLESGGILTVAIRPPTVAPQACRLRITVNAAHSIEQLDHLLATLGKANTI